VAMNFSTFTIVFQLIFMLFLVLMLIISPAEMFLKENR